MYDIDKLKSVSPALREREARKNLPIGHYAIEQAKEDCDREYQDCKMVENKFQSEIFRSRLYMKDAEFVVSKLARVFCVTTPKIVIDQTHGTHCYDGRIVLMYLPVQMRSLLHEFSHHVVRKERLCGVHGEDFLWVEELVFTAAEKYLSLKK